MKKVIKYNYYGCDELQGFANSTFFPKEIYEKYSFVLSKKPDVVFYSCFVNKPSQIVKYKNATKVFFSGENVSPDFIFFDYWIGFDFIDFKERYFRNPLCFWTGEYENKPISKNCERNIFCDFIYSHDDSNETRKRIFDCISKYKPVSSFGTLYNNTGKVVSRSEKSKIQMKSKFSLIIESTNYDGFITEKIMDAFNAGSIPIYFGTKRISYYFNKERFINSNDFESMDDLVKYLKEVDENEDLYNKKVSASIFSDNFNYSEHMKKYCEFLSSIFDSAGSLKRDISYSNNRYSKIIKYYSALVFPWYSFKSKVRKWFRK